jgi:hypothetical protein
MMINEFGDSATTQAHRSALACQRQHAGLARGYAVRRSSSLGAD